MIMATEWRTSSRGERYEVGEYGAVQCPSCAVVFNVDGDAVDGMGPYCPYCNYTGKAAAHRESLVRA